MDKKIKSRLYLARSCELINFKHHQCSLKFCNPQNEQNLIDRNLLKGPPQSSNLFICKYGQFHSCSSELCMIEGYCLVSGMTMGIRHNYSSYDPNDYRTWESTKDQQKETTTRKDDDILSKIEHLIDNILYSPIRKTISENWKINKTKKCTKERQLFITTCNDRRIPINLIDLAMINSKYSYCDSYLETLDKDLNRLYIYVDFVSQIHSKILKYTNNKPCVESITLAVLYKLQHGIIIDNVELIPIDLYLQANLPLMNDLPQFGIDKKKFTQGERAIQFMYELARNDGANFEELMIVPKKITEIELIKLGKK